ncbi:MAG: CoA transferase [Proteobacteria bacterium]|nr:CoA transferase [Pseudomonadota bacterium]
MSDAIVGGWIGERNQADALEIFGRAEVTASAVYDIEDIIADPHIRERGVIVDLPDGDVETAPMHNVLPRFSDTPGTFRLPAPGLGEHTGALLAELGIAEERQVELKERGVI